ncbi:response regulator [Motilimonas pumila]|uniref:DNA-binding response regulator n=1 Tax=Motilimonas pumila TaxID=2303987 RepID=A0A418YIU4_9GAMM|nr:response regulator transcription factor [Motilimonas pumila]RJG50532.1 DNA-binding response regulator [Motilimonas pumila]
MKILVVEDDKTTLEYIQKGFQEQGYAVDVSENGPDGLFLATSQEYDVIILDRMLPQMDGLKVLSALRATGSQTPVIFLSALSHVDERIKGLKAGSDDYLTKPFSFQELLVRVEILIQRNSQQSTLVTELKVGDLLMDLVGHKVTRADREIKLQPKEFQLLRYLLEHQDQVISRTLLFESVWDYHFDPKTNVIDVHVAKLRKKLEEYGESQLIHTVRGAGYVVRAP